MARMKVTPTAETEKSLKSVEPDPGSDSKGGEDDLFKSLDSDELELIDNIAKPPPERNLD